MRISLPSPPTPWFTRPHVRGLALLLLMLATSHIAAQSVWNGGGADALWSNGENWNGGAAPTSPKELHFTGVTNLAPQNDLVSFNITRLEFLSGAGAFSLAGNDVTLSGNVVNNSVSAQSIVLNMALTAGAHIFQVNGGSLTLAGNLTETGGVAAVSKNGSGTLILSGDNSFTGAFSIAAGVVRATSSTAFGTSAGGVTITSGARIELQGATITGEALNLNGDGGDSQGALRAIGGGTSTWTGDIGISSAIGVFANRIGTNGSSTLALSGGISGAGDLSIRTDGNNAGVIALSGSTKTYTGGTNLVIGELRLGSANVLPTGTVLSIGNSSNANFATLNLDGNNQQLGGLVSLGTLMTMRVTSATAATLTLNNSTDQTYAGTLEGAIALTKTGTGTLTLSGPSDNNYTGQTLIQEGALTLAKGRGLGNNGTFADSQGTYVSSGAALNLSGNIVVGVDANGEMLHLSGTGQGGNGALRNLSDTNSWRGRITLDADAEIQADAGSSLTLDPGSGNAIAGAFNVTFDAQDNATIIVADPIATGSGAVTKTGGGMLIYSGLHTYTGNTNINAGVLRLDASQRIVDTTAITFQGTGTLRLNGFAETVGGIFSSGGAGIIENENANTGTLTVTINNTAAVAATDVVLQTFSGVLRDGDGVGTDGSLALIVSKTGSGAGTSVLELTNANTYTGTTTVNSTAALRVSHAGALGAGGTVANGTVVTNGGRVEVSGGVTVANEVITLTGSGGSPNSAGALRSTGTGTAIWAGKVILGAATGDGLSPSTQAARIGATDAVLEISGQISDEGLGRDLAVRNNTATKTIISGTSNNYRNTYIVIGELEIGGTNALPAGTILSIGNNSNTGSQKFDLNGFNQTVRGLTDLGTSNITNLVSNDTSATTATLTLSTQTGDDHQYGIIAANTATIGGNVAIVKTGAGVQRLGSNNTYLGATTVTGGILQVGAAGTAAARDNGDTGNNVATNILTVNTAGTVAGTGNIAGTSAVTHLIGPGGAIAAGDVVNAAAIDPTGIGTLGVIGGLNASGGTIRLQISGRTSAATLPLYFDSGYAAAAAALVSTSEAAATSTGRGNHDLLVVSNQLTVSSTSTVAVTWHDLATSGYSPAAGDSFDLLDWSGVALSSSFNVGSNFRAGGTGGGSLDLPALADALFWDVSQFLSNGVLIIATPEPGRALLLMIGLGTLGLRRRKQS